MLPASPFLQTSRNSCSTISIQMTGVRERVCGCKCKGVEKLIEDVVKIGEKKRERRAVGI